MGLLKFFSFEKALGVFFCKFIFVWCVCGLHPVSAESPCEPAIIAQDRERIQNHLAYVESTLRARDVSHLTEAQRAARLRNLDLLHAYWAAGVFPHNTLIPERHPIFIDERGRACAVAFLMLNSPQRDAAERIAAAENLDYLAQIQEPEVGDWLAQSGLSFAEAAWIQPNYDYCYECTCEIQPVCAPDGRSYLNACYAVRCMDVSGPLTQGCCEGDQSLYSSRFSCELTQEQEAAACNTPPPDLSFLADVAAPSDEGLERVPASCACKAAYFVHRDPSTKQNIFLLLAAFFIFLIFDWRRHENS